MGLREKFLNPEVRTKVVELAGIGRVGLKEATFGAALEMERMAAENGDDDSPDSGGARSRAMLEFVAASLVDPDSGERVFEDSELGMGCDALRELPAKSVRKLAEEVVQMNGLDEDALKDAVGNSEGAPG